MTNTSLDSLETIANVPLEVNSLENEKTEVPDGKDAAFRLRQAASGLRGTPDDLLFKSVPKLQVMPRSRPQYADLQGRVKDTFSDMVGNLEVASTHLDENPDKLSELAVPLGRYHPDLAGVGEYVVNYLKDPSARTINLNPPGVTGNSAVWLQKGDMQATPTRIPGVYIVDVAPDRRGVSTDPNWRDKSHELILIGTADYQRFARAALNVWEAKKGLPLTPPESE